MQVLSQGPCKRDNMVLSWFSLDFWGPRPCGGLGMSEGGFCANMHFHISLDQYHNATSVGKLADVR